MFDLIPAITLVAFAIVLLLLWCFQRSAKSARVELQQRLEALEKEAQVFRHALHLHDEGMHEMRSGAQGVGKKVKELALLLEQTREKVAELSNLDPDTRVYGTAARLVDSGASIEELMQECDLPRGEAELLYSMRQQKTPRT